MPLSEALRRHRVAIASQLALLMAVVGIVVVAINADGYETHEAQLNDGGIWVTNSRDGFYGRINKPIGQLDGAVFSELDTQLDVVQQGAVVLGHNLSSSSLVPIDPATVEQPDGEVATLPGGAQVGLAGGSLAVLDPGSGRLWAERVDPRLGNPLVGNLDAQSPPLATAGPGSALAVTERGRLLVLTAEDDTITTLRPTGTGFGAPSTTGLPREVEPGATVTAVGERTVVLDAGTGALTVLPEGGDEAAEPVEVEVAAGSVLQVAGPESTGVLVATGDRLLDVDLVTGEERVLADGVGGRPSAPVRLGACTYGAWSGGSGTVAVQCGDDPAQVSELGTESSDLVFRVNRGEIVLNDRADGAVWNIDSDEPTRIDNWDAYKNKVTDEEDQEQDEQEDVGDRRPPEAKPDRLGARPGRTTVLHPLDNDTAPEGRLLSIRSVQDVSDPDAEVTISPDGQTVQVRLPQEAPTVTFEYYVDDGRQDVSAHATVTVVPRPEEVNAPPALRESFEPRVWTVPSGGTLDVPVLPDWRDNEDGDPVSLVEAEASGGVRSGAVARATSAGRVRFTAPAKPGTVKVAYEVTDGTETVTEDLTFQVQDKLDRRAFPATAEPDVVAGQAGEPITIRPLANDLPGSDPVTPTAVVELAGTVAPVGGAEVSTDLTEGTITFRSDTARTYFLDYGAKFGNAPFDEGRVRVDVRPAERPPREPVAMPDTVTLHGQTATLVDVLANDVDPTGGMLVVQGAEALREGQLDVAVVDGRWVRVSARQGSLQPNPQVVRYTISNGNRAGAQGEIVVTQRPLPEDNAPVTETDRVTVRAGGGASVPVLDNDFSPAGDELTLVADVAGQDAGRLAVQAPGEVRVETGEAYVTGRFVRYVAPADLADAETFTVRYLASNSSGLTTPGRLEVTVVPQDRRNNPPAPPALEGRAVAGDTLRLRVPGVGVDPDGDPVTITGLGSAPRLGRLVTIGANSLAYQAYPGSVGTDEFTYTVTDGRGGTGTGTARVAVVAPGTPQPPLAVPDTVTVETGRTARVEVLANDLVAAGDRVSLELLDAPPGVELASSTGPLLIPAPEVAEGEEGRTLDVVYRVTNGLDSSQATVTLRTVTPYNNPPVVFDAFGQADDGASVTVDVLETAYDPDGPPEALRVTGVVTPPDVASSVTGGEITVARGPEPAVYPFTVVDADGGASTASLYVPAAAADAPVLRAGTVIPVESGGSVTEQLADHVVNPSGGPVRFTLKSRIWTSPDTQVRAEVQDDTTFEVSADEDYAGPAAVVVEVTTGTSVDDPDGVTAVLSIPVQVGAEVPILRCPSEPIEIAQDQRLDLEIASLCHVWTPTPEMLAELRFTADWSASVEGLAIVEPSGPTIGVAAEGSATPGIEATLEVSAEEGEAGELTFVVVESPPPSLAPIRIADLRAGQSRTIDLAPYLRPGISDPEPTLVEVSQVTDLDISAEPDGASGLRITAGDRVDGRAEFSVTMSDVAESTGEERQAEGRLVVEVLDVPDAPNAPVPGNAVRDEEVALSWQAPEANGSPVDRYRIRGTDGVSQECATTACEIGGLTNGQDYRFQVQAHNAVGWSEWSDQSAVATPDAKPGRVGPVELVREGDGLLVLRWTPPTTQTSAIRRYHVSYEGGEPKTTSRPTITVTGLDNNNTYAFTVAAENDFDIGEARTSARFQSVGPPGRPAAPTVTDQKTPGDSGAVTLTWPAVDPNGPTPVRYTVLRDGRPLPACTGITATRCDNSGMTYDGTQYRYAVRAVNKNGEGRTTEGPASTWSAVGQPEAWGSWSVAPTGQNAQGTASFTVPDSRGAQSRVRVLVGDAAAKELEGRGQRTETFGVPSNDGPYPVTLEVCNESGACERSTTQNVQTYGPFTDNSIISATSQGERAGPNMWRVRWTITVDTNGDPAELAVNGNIGGGAGDRSETYRLDGVDVQTITTPWKEVPAENSEILRVTLSDSSPRRAAVSKSFRYNAPPRDNPSVTIRRGSACIDPPSGGRPGCNTQGSGTDCVVNACGRIVFTTENFYLDEVTCQVYDGRNGQQFSNRRIRANATVEPGTYYGWAGATVWAVCNGERSNTYTWPN